MKKINPVFTVSLIIVLALLFPGIVKPELLDALSSVIHQWIITNFGWVYLLSAFLFLVFSIMVAFSKYGSLKLGKDHEAPQYSYFGWFSMLFAAGMGIGLIFWGVAEPISHFTSPPGYITPESGQAAEFAMVRSFFHWGLHPWGVYIVMSLSIAYFSFRRDMPPLISSCFYPLLGNKIFKTPGRIIDIMAVFATVFGITTSLGLGAMQITSGLSSVFGIPDTTGITLAVIGCVTVMFLISSMTGLDKGIQILSKTNIMLALLLLGFMLVAGPTSYIFNIFTTTLGDYFSSILKMSLSSNPFKGYDWTKEWTLFYWAWWIAWAPFVGLFVASISRGRTVREFISGALIVPALLTFLWFSVFGGAAFNLEIVQGIKISEAVSDNVSTALFSLFSHYPFSSLLTLITVALLVVFFVTSADSATFVLAMMTSKGDKNPPQVKKIIWGITVSASACVLMLTGGLESLQKMSIAAALPFTLIMLFLCLCLLRGFQYEFRNK
ncbi:MAG: BCCT family transporter [Desulfobacteraceae bacterium]